MSSLLFSTKWRRLQLPGSKNYIFLLIVVIVFISCVQICCGDIEPKPNYDDVSTQMAKLHDDHHNNNKLMDNAKINKMELNGGNANGIENENHGVAPKLDESTKSSLPLSDLGFIHAFVASISVILVSELGDKTFFIAAIMAMRHPRITVFTGAIAALALMTILSAVFGMAAQIIPRVYTYYISTFLFAVFGLKMLKEGYYMKASDAQEELEEVQQDLKKREDELMKTLKDGGSSVRNSNNDLRSINRGSQSSLRMHRIKEDYDSDNDEQTRAMLPGNSSSNGGGGVILSNNIVVSDGKNDISNIVSSTTVDMNITGRRSQSAMNISSSQIDNNKSNSAIVPSNRYSINSTQEGIILNQNTSSQSLTGGGGGSVTKLNKADINANGTMMELKQFGSKKSLEKEVSTASIQDPESGIIRRGKQPSAAYMTSRILMQAFTMTFLAEWGDRSQLTTIILSAREDIYGVIVGGILGHSICTGLAVIGGRMIAQRISVRTVTLVGGVVFILFAISALFFNPNDD